MIRAFVGIGMPDDVAAMLAGALVGLDVGNPVPAENFHLTLAFLGEHPLPVLEDVADALSQITSGAFDLDIKGLGTFGSAPRILFAEVAPSRELSDLRKRTRRAAAAGGVELAHERYRPHVTLARMGQGLVGEEAERLRAHIARRMGQVKAHFRVTGFTLYESRLGRSGPIYSALEDFPLSPF